MKRFIKNILLIGFLNIVLIGVTPLYAQLIEPEAAPTADDDFLILLEGAETTTNVEDLDKAFNPGKALVSPWSDSYWPTYKGVIAARYKMQGQPNSKSWPDYYRHYINNSAEGLIATGQLDKLSPAEKYDLLIGDRSWSLTRHLWKKGQDSMNRYGRVATWTGICHGWAAASHIGIPRPDRSIVVTDVTGHYDIPFSPFDLMGLVSYYWAESRAKNFFVGNRCKIASPRTEDGRVIDPKCFDNNPMTWHLGVTNRVGKLQKSIIMDTSANTQVWNYVVDNYHFSYFNPQTMEFSSQLQDAIALRSEFRQDPFHAHRSERTKYLVGVIMDVFHPGAISPHSGVPILQLMDWKRFVYDLEIDENMNVIGGEWHSEEHPDFLWGYPESVNPFRDSIANVEVPTEAEPMGYPFVDPALAEQAVESSRRGRTHITIINKLVAKSTQRNIQSSTPATPEE